MNRRTTYILARLLITSAIAAAVAFAYMQRERSQADTQSKNLRDSLRLLVDLQHSAKSPIAAARLDGADLNRRIREAATAAGISDRLSSVEPNRPARLRESDYNELMVFVRFENVSLRQSAAFMHRLSASDPSCRIKTIELEAPANGAADQQWTSDITLAYLSYAPREAGQAEAP